MFIVRDEFSVGESATASCKSDAPASMIEWLRDGVVVESAAFTGIQELDLVFSPVNDSIHTQVYVCRVTREGRRGMIVTAAQNFTVNVDGKMVYKLYHILFILSLSSQFHLMPSLPLSVVQALPQLGWSTTSPVMYPRQWVV